MLSCFNSNNKTYKNNHQCITSFPWGTNHWSCLLQAWSAYLDKICTQTTYHWHPSKALACSGFHWKESSHTCRFLGFFSLLIFCNYVGLGASKSVVSWFLEAGLKSMKVFTNFTLINLLYCHFLWPGGKWSGFFSPFEHKLLFLLKTR